MYGVPGLKQPMAIIQLQGDEKMHAFPAKSGLSWWQKNAQSTRKQPNKQVSLS
jgi:hypothetical protein